VSQQTYHHPRPFTLESGITLPGYHLGYTTYGQLNTAKDNVVWVFHALTANSQPEEWWPGLVGSGRFFDPSRYFIVCVNMPGSCYGSTHALDVNPVTGTPWYHAFPLFTTRDMIRAYQPLRKQLGIETIHIGIGGSMGGQQLLEWAVEEPELFEHIVPIATNAYHSPWGVAFNASQRMCIEADGTWLQAHPQAGMQGLRAARSVALLSYRHYNTYGQTQTIVSSETPWQLPTEGTRHGAESYQRHQGEKLAQRFNAFSYYRLSQGMDSHNVGRNRGGVEKALQQITAKTMIIGISSDILFPPVEQELLAKQITGARHKLIHSPYGHDGFLLEAWQIENALVELLVCGAAQPAYCITSF
jgi:homoserine O-acetyltransferase/O-succinyltransferase